MDRATARERAEADMDAAIAGRPRAVADALALIVLDDHHRVYETEAAMVAAWDALRIVAFEALRLGEASVTQHEAGQDAPQAATTTGSSLTRVV